MALDLYVGPVSRYLSGDWKNLGQQAAEAHGIEYRVVGAGARGGGGLFGRWRRDKAYARWRQGVEEALRRAGVRGELWDDGAGRPYLTDRPGWEGLASLQGKLACLLYPDAPEPTGALRLDGLAEDPRYERAMLESRSGAALMSVTVWLPGEFEGKVTFPGLGGEPSGAASVGALNAALDEMCALWGKDRAALWDLATDQPAEDDDFDAAALHGLAVFSRLAAEAARQNLPMLLDF